MSLISEKVQVIFVNSKHKWSANCKSFQSLIFFAPTAYRNFYQPVLFLILKLHKWKQVKCYIQHVKNTDVKITVNHYTMAALLLLVKYVLSIDPSLKDSCAARVQLLFNLWHPKIKHLSPFSFALFCPARPSLALKWAWTDPSLKHWPHN